MNSCKMCKKQTKNRLFCGNDCKFKWQARDIPSKEWLENEYVTKNRSMNDIAREVGKNQKTVYSWFIKHGIPKRPRGHNWQSTLIIGSGENNPFYGRKHTPETLEKMSESTKGPSPWLRGEVHHQYGKRGPLSRTWKGGLTPERQSLYASDEWKLVVKKVWQRDDARCRRCNLNQNENRGKQFDIHHIVAFADCKELRTELSNLILLCHDCHLWVHSNKNKQNLFIVR